MLEKRDRKARMKGNFEMGEEGAKLGREEFRATGEILEGGS